MAKYRARYFGREPNDARLHANLDFYSNTGRCQPNNLLHSELVARWMGDYRRLEVEHGYIQWLFPIHEPGMNCESQVLQRHERDIMCADEAIRERVLQSYRLMLDFYGFELQDPCVGGAVVGKPNQLIFICR